MRRIGSRLIARPPARSAGYAAGYPVQGKGSWTPAKLFAGGIAGAWYEPSPTTCYTDVAMTTPAGVGDTVAADTDLSGNGNHRKQSTVAAQPILRQTAGGLYYLEYDGIDDYLRALFTTIPQPVTYVLAARVGNNQDYAVLIDSAQSAARCLINKNGSLLSGKMYAGINVVSPAGSWAAEDAITSAIFNGVASVYRRNGVQLVAGDAGTQSLGDGATWFAQHDIKRHMAGRDYGGIVIGALLSDTDLANAEQHFSAKAGVTL